MSQEEVIPRPEHPRPDFVREPWFNLNGRWRFAFDPQDVGEQLRWYRVHHPARLAGMPGMPGMPSTDPSASFGTGPTSGSLVEDPFGDEIVVPFPWESHLSTICAPDYKGAAWYQRAITVPLEWAEAVETIKTVERAAPPGATGATGLPSAGDTAESATSIGAGVRWRRHPYVFSAQWTGTLRCGSTVASSASTMAATHVLRSTSRATSAPAR